MAKNETKQTVIVIGSLCLVCSVIVSVAAVGLKPKQQENALLDKQSNLLMVANHSAATPQETKELYGKFIEARLVDLATGEYVDGDADSYNQRAAAKDPAQSTRLTPEQDIAGLGSRANIASVYLAKDEQGNVEGVILPVHGRGLWSTMYAFVNITPDGTTVKGLTYYDQGETPGLGGEIANPNWMALWKDKKVFDENGKPALHIVKGQADPNSEYDIDGLSGATLTANGVQYSMDFWMGDDGFGPYLKKLNAGGADNG